jgi:hypothetical protein
MCHSWGAVEDHLSDVFAGQDLFHRHRYCQVIKGCKIFKYKRLHEMHNESLSGVATDSIARLSDRCL